MSSIDVIVPCYRYGHFLRECVGSILAQKIDRLRVLIIDDASPDDTSQVAAALTREDPRVTYLRHCANKGHIATYNEGIAWASAEYMLILSADDYLLPGALSRAAIIMDKHPEVGFTFGKVIRFEGDGSICQTITGFGESDTRDWKVLSGIQFIILSGACNIVPTATAVVRTKLQQQVGGYRPELPHTADMEMWLRLAAHASVGMSPEYEAVYRRHSDNMSLAYLGKTWLPDLQERKAAFDLFFQTWSHMVPDPQRLYRKLIWSLGCDAIGFASAAFNQGNIDVCEQISELALEICPQVKKSWPWTKLACKRNLGSKRWRALQSAVSGMRHVGASFKRAQERSQI
jgi:glycosyltransferase involved in cell wall biosynthesis